jgi:hypothetical protein
MAPNKNTRSRKVTRAKASRKASVRASRKAPGLIVPEGTKRVYEIY